ncbi:uncharacterized protein LOC143916717 [Arctopsyche grandis]|uniref:uncharacterized protein LOC143916717 n=1 Tax=Arctopsyche grandis TaxID=121162 RepID=UPI00406D6C09
MGPGGMCPGGTCPDTLNLTWILCVSREANMSPSPNQKVNLSIGVCTNSGSPPQGFLPRKQTKVQHYLYDKQTITLELVEQECSYREKAQPFAMKAVVAVVLFVVSAQCSDVRYARDVSELYSSPNLQTTPIRPQEDLQEGYDYPKPAPQPRPIYPEPTVIQPRPEYGPPPVIQPQPNPVYLPPRPQPLPSYPQTRPSYPQPQPSYPQPQPSYPQPQPSYPQPRPSYPQPQPSYPQPQPSYPEPQTSYPQPQPRPVYPQPRPIYPTPEVNIPNSGYNYPNPSNVERVQSTGQESGPSEKIFWPFTNKYGPPTNQYPGSNIVGFPNGNSPHKFSFLSSLFPGFNNNYNGQRIEAASDLISTTSADQGLNSIGDVRSLQSGGSGYDYPNPNEQQPPFELPDGMQFRAAPVNP